MKKRRTHHSAGKNLVCPRCYELLTHDDVEEFGRCPYCDYAFPYDDELEEFLLRPVVRQWVRYANAQVDFETRA